MNQNYGINLMEKKENDDFDDVEEGEIMDDDEASVVPTVNDVEDGELLRSKVEQEPKPSSPVDDKSSKSTSNSTVNEMSTRKRHSYSPKNDSYPSKRGHWSDEPIREETSPILRLCKFFREGYCRDGQTCSFSHDARYSNRKPEVCKFFQEGHCRKGLQCDLFHGEFPCKLYHQGKCSNYVCKYSHEPLNDFTRQIYDRILQDDILASQIIIPQGSIKRKVLLPKPKIPPIIPQQITIPIDSWREDNIEKPIIVAESWRDDPDEVFVSKIKKPLLPTPTSITTPVVDTWREDPDELYVVKEAAVQQLLFEKIGIKGKEEESWRSNSDTTLKSIEEPQLSSIPPATTSESWKEEKHLIQKSPSPQPNQKIVVENFDTPKSSLFSTSMPKLRESKFSFNEILQQMSNITPETFTQNTPTTTTTPETISDLNELIL